jgi:hypothetical protein
MNRTHPEEHAMSDLFGAISDGISNVAKSAKREVSRAGKEFVTHIEEDFDSISKAIDEGGFVGGAIQAADVFSPGHRLAQDLDALNIIPDDPVLKELISGGVNLATPGPTQLLAAKDLIDAIGAMQKNQPPAAGSTIAPSQGAEHPSKAPPSQKGWVTGEDLVYGGGRTHGDTGGSCGGGFSVEAEVGCGGRFTERLQDALARLKKQGERCPGGTGPADGELEREIQKILANPNLMFEDMIFLLMRAFIKDTRKEVTSIAGELRGTSKAQHADKKDQQKLLESARAELADAQASKDPKVIQEASNKVQNLKDNMDMTAAERSDARADKFEELKQVMQRLSEMEQALSNVLNTMHEGSMAAIRNIR